MPPPKWLALAFSVARCKPARECPPLGGTAGLGDGPADRVGEIFGEALELPIARRDDRRDDRPGDGELRVVPGNADLAARVVGRIDLVEHVGRLVAEHAEAVGEADWHPEQPSVKIAQLGADVLAEGGRIRANVDGDVPDLPS